MAGNSKRKGAIRTSKKGATAGSGGRGKQKLEGRGPTPKATERDKHPAAKRARAAERAAEKRGSTRVSRPRDRDGIEWVAGRNSVLEALRANIPANALYMQQFMDADDRVKEILQLANDRGLPFLEAPRTELDRNTDGAVHQGVALRIPPYSYLDPIDLLEDAFNNDEAAFVVALDGVTDPRNLGAIVRSASAFGAAGVVMTERRAAAMTAAAWKTSAGAAARLRVAQVTNLARTIEDAQKLGCFVVGLDGESDVTLSEMKVARENLMIVVGSEGKGLSRLVREKCDLVVSIPIMATTESLNASVATAIAMFWVDEQRRKK